MTIVDPRLAPLAAIFDLNTDLLLNCLDGLSDAEGRERLAGGGNSITFLAAHLTDSRHFLAARVGHPLDNPMAPYLEGARGFEEVRAWPALEQVRSAWRSVSTHLQRTLASLAPEQLSRRHAHRFPLGDSTQLGLIAFLAQHDAYHLGQVAFLRRQLGRPAMSYARPANA
jgi:uncharacterized damage-inducible protein DinB